MGKDNLKFRYERKRIVKEKHVPALCPDYEPRFELGDNCKRADLCKNATSGWKNQAFGSCYGGTRKSELKQREGALASGNFGLR